MEKNVVTIDLEKYNELIEAKIKLETAREIIAKDKNEYGYSSATSTVIDTLLGVARA